MAAVLLEPEYELPPPPYDATIYCSVPAPVPWRMWPASAKWLIRFHFNDNKLAEIHVEIGWISL
jgi:hypothetical protein